MIEVTEFENAIAKFFNSPYAVAVDSCTHAIELCLRVEKVKSTGCPKHTYPSTPMTFVKLGLEWEFTNEEWQEYYYLKNTNIIDAAWYYKANSYISNTYMCLSFQHKKPLGLSRGGMILLDDKDKAKTLTMMAHDGRERDKLWMEQDIKTVGYHYYMSPRLAANGLQKMQTENIIYTPKSYRDYPDISKLTVFNNIDI
jgi:dTDP-4-amino-4,6-dideoxygalactose transaminase